MSSPSPTIHRKGSPLSIRYRSVTENRHFHLLPNELLSHIFTFLEPEEAGRFSRVSKLWNACGNNQKLWRFFCLSKGLVPEHEHMLDWKNYYLENRHPEIEKKLKSSEPDYYKAHPVDAVSVCRDNLYIAKKRLLEGGKFQQILENYTSENGIKVFSIPEGTKNIQFTESSCLLINTQGLLLVKLEEECKAKTFSIPVKEEITAFDLNEKWIAWADWENCQLTVWDICSEKITHVFNNSQSRTRGKNIILSIHIAKNTITCLTKIGELISWEAIKAKQVDYQYHPLNESFVSYGKTYVKGYLSGKIDDTLALLGSESGKVVTIAREFGRSTKYVIHNSSVIAVEREKHLIFSLDKELIVKITSMISGEVFYTLSHIPITKLKLRKEACFFTPLVCWERIYFHPPGFIIVSADRGFHVWEF